MRWGGGGWLGGGGVRKGDLGNLLTSLPSAMTSTTPGTVTLEWPVRVGCISTVGIGPSPNTCVR